MRIENKSELLAMTGEDYEHALITLHHCEDATLTRIGISRSELDSLISDAGITPPELQVVGEPAPEPPIRVTPWQFRKALNELGLRQQVEDAVAAADQDIKDGWEYATEIVRTDPLVVMMGEQMEKTEAELDQIFELAETL